MKSVHYYCPPEASIHSQFPVRRAEDGAAAAAAACKWQQRTADQPPRCLLLKDLCVAFKNNKPDLKPRRREREESKTVRRKIPQY